MDLLKIDEKLKKYKDIKLSKQLLGQMRENYMIQMTYNSNAIEGNTMNLYETRVFLEDGITIGGKSLKEHLEIINHAEAIKYIEEIVNKKIELNEYEIKNIHLIVTKGIEGLNSGKYREIQVEIIGAQFLPPAPYLVQEKMEELMEWYKKTKVHPIEKASTLHGLFTHIHPFDDGNGRTGRLLLNFELMKNSYPPIVIEKEERVEYLKSLSIGSITGKWDEFTEFVSNKLEKRIDYINELKKEEIKIKKIYK